MGDDREPDFYAVLEVSPDARPQVIDAAWRQLVKDYHPDVHGSDPAAESRIKRINHAHDILSDPAQRAEYDRRRAATGAASPPRPRDGATRSEPSRDPAELPVLAVDPPVVELRPGGHDRYLWFSVHVRQVGGPAWDSARHMVGVAFDDPWRASMFTAVQPRGAAPPLDIDFEVSLDDLSAKVRHAGRIRVEARPRGSSNA